MLVSESRDPRCLQATEQGFVEVKKIRRVDEGKDFITVIGTIIWRQAGKLRRE